MKINANFLKYRSHFERMVRPAGIEQISIFHIQCGFIAFLYCFVSSFVSSFLNVLLFNLTTSLREEAIQKGEFDDFDAVSEIA